MNPRYCQRCRTDQPAATFCIHGYCALCAEVLEDSLSKRQRRVVRKFEEKLAQLDNARENLLNSQRE